MGVMGGISVGVGACAFIVLLAYQIVVELTVRSIILNLVFRRSSFTLATLQMRLCISQGGERSLPKPISSSGLGW